MIGKTAATTKPYSTGPVTDPNTASPSTDASSSLSLQRRSSLEDSSGPLQMLQPSVNALPSPADAQPAAGAPVSGRLTQARDLISGFLAGTLRRVAGGDRHTDLAARAPRLEKALNDALDAAQAMSPIDDAAKSKVKRLLAKAIEVHHDLSRWKGTSDEDKASLLHKCIDMHEHVERLLGEKRTEEVMDIAAEAHAIYFKMATGMVVVELTRWQEWTNPRPVLAGTPCAPSEVDLLSYARAASMNIRAHRNWGRPDEFLLSEIYKWKPGQPLPLNALPVHEAVDGARLTKREIDLWCSNPPQNPWPREARLQPFYESAKLAALDVRRREMLLEHLPDASHPEYDARPDMAKLIAGFAAGPTDGV